MTNETNEKCRVTRQGARQARPERAVIDGFLWTAERWGEALRSSLLEPLAEHFFSSLPLRFRGDDGQEARDWAEVACTIGVARDRLLRVEQVHGTTAYVARRSSPAAPGSPTRPGRSNRQPSDGPQALPAADIILSDDPDTAVAVQVADCVPLLIGDRRSRAVAAAHAGWRGTAAGAAAASVAALGREFGSRPSDLVVAQGPSIGPCCYVVGDEVRQEFARGVFGAIAGRWFSTGPDRALRLDLWSANRDQLVEAGVRPENLQILRLCTACHPELFPSYRRDGRGTGRIAAVVRARPRRPGGGEGRP